MYRKLNNVHLAQFGGKFFGLCLFQFGNAQGLGRRETCTGEAQRTSSTMKLPHMILKGWLPVTTNLSKPTGCMTPRVNPNVSL